MSFPPDTDPLEVVRILSSFSPTQVIDPALDRIEQLSTVTKRYYFVDGSIIQVTTQGSEAIANFVNKFGNVVDENGSFVPVYEPLDPGSVEPSGAIEKPVNTGDPTLPASDPNPSPSLSPSPTSFQTSSTNLIVLLRQIAASLGISLKF